MQQFYVYILTNFTNTVLYTGVTNDLVRRIFEHRNKLADGFTNKYNVNKLVYYEIFYDIESAILREKAIKNLVRRKKLDLINKDNSQFMDLYDSIG
jgi:putative endonuclease